MTTLTHAAVPVKPTADLLSGWDPSIARFLGGIPEIRALAPADEYGPEHDAWRYELGPEPGEADRDWWAGQNTEGGMAEGESDRSDVAGWTLDAWTYRLEMMAEATLAQDRYEAGIPTW